VNFHRLPEVYKSLDPVSLQALLGSEKPPVLLDVRGRDEAARGGLPDARLIPLGELPGRYSELETGEPIAVYCHSGVRSASACRFLAERGFTDLYHLEGGIVAWARAGLPVA
jgi:rhodanese-related sulfurtransferase